MSLYYLACKTQVVDQLAFWQFVVTDLICNCHSSRRCNGQESPDPVPTAVQTCQGFDSDRVQERARTAATTATVQTCHAFDRVPERARTEAPDYDGSSQKQESATCCELLCHEDSIEDGSSE